MLAGKRLIEDLLQLFFASFGDFFTSSAAAAALLDTLTECLHSLLFEITTIVTLL